MRKYFILTALLLIVNNLMMAQKPTQNIRGVVLDAKTMQTLPGANILIVNINKGTITDTSGYFILKDIAVGRYTLQVSFIGYEPVVIPELLLTSGSEKVLEVKLEPAFTEVEEVIVNPTIRKDRPQNSMATVSARTFSVEEANRYAGAIDDPGRMAGSFAGVTTIAPHLNAIVVRGNAPKGLAWRLEGVDIPVPSHFSGSNVAGGGGLTVFSSQLLANSDFYTGAFPAEFGNATAGVFDMKLRSGSKYEREYALKVGIQGIEAAAEGPFKKSSGGASYLFNYRYSTMALIFPLLPEVNYTDELPVYQDLSFKINIPSKNGGTFALWGIGGLSKSKMDGTDNPEKWIYPENRERMNFHYNMGAIGLSHSKSISDNTFIRSTISFNGSQHLYNEKSRLNRSNPDELYPLYDIEMTNSKPALTSKITHVFTSRFSVAAGIDAVNHQYNLNGKTINYHTDEFVEFMDGSGSSWLLEGYIQSKLKITKDFFITGGLNTSWFEINREFLTEPRFSASWQLIDNHQISFGYGNHSQIEPLFVYFVSDKNAEGENEFPNKKLKRMKAHHFVVAYDWALTDNMRIKIEPYYQHLYRVPVVDNSSYSMVNFLSDWSFSKELVNKGTGTNIGIDVTFERFLTDGFYFMTTASVYDSNYTGGNGQTYKTRYNGGYVMNLLGGKEWEVFGKNMLSLNIKFTFMGPYWHYPVDEDASLLANTIIYNDNKPFVYRNSEIESMTDLTVNYRINGSHGASVFAVQLKNILGEQYMGKKFNMETKSIENDFFSSPVPFISYKYEF